MAKLTNRDWGKIHAMAWTDPEFRRLLETDPTKAIKAYGRKVGKTFDKLVKVGTKPKGTPKSASLDELAHIHPHPPSCC